MKRTSSTFVVAAFATTLLSACSGGGATSGALPQSAAATTVARAPAQPPATTPTPSHVMSRTSVASDAGAPDLLLFDNFSNGATTQWWLQSGTWSTCDSGGGKALCASDDGIDAAFAGPPWWTDYRLQSTITIANVPGSRSGIALLARVVDESHFDDLEIDRESNGSQQWEIWRNDGEAWTTLARGWVPFSANQAYVVRFDVVGTTLAASLSRDGGSTFETLGSATDARFGQGHVGLRAFGGMTGAFTNVSVARLDASGATPTSPRAQSATNASPQTAPASGDTIAPVGTQYFPSGPFAQRVVSPQIDPRSDWYLGHVLGDDAYALGKLQFGSRASGATDDNAPVYIAHDRDPAYTIHCHYYTHCPLEGVTVHIPAGAVPAGRLGNASFLDDGSHDQHLAVRNVDEGIEYDTWLTAQPNGRGGTLDVGYGGAFPFADGGVGSGGATAAGFALSQGRLRAVDLLAGHIPTALFFGTPCENGHVAPAIGDDGGHTDGCPPIGERIWLDSTPSDVAASGAPRDVQTILNALHEYGGYIGDRCSSCTLEIALESGAPYDAFGLADPWQEIASHFPDEIPAGDASEYHIALRTGNIDLTRHLHFISP